MPKKPKHSKQPKRPTLHCAMCRKFTSVKNSHVPGMCLATHGLSLAHRICSKCWFDKFALEGESHTCPGCVKNLPLTDKRLTTKPTREPKPEEIIEID